MDMYSLSELANEIGLTRQTVHEAVELACSKQRWPTPKTGIPKPDAWTQSGRPLWMRSTLDTAGLLGRSNKAVTGTRVFVTPPQ